MLVDTEKHVITMILVFKMYQVVEGGGGVGEGKVG